MLTAEQALQRLREGNQRFAAGLRSLESMASQSKRSELSGGQEPFAIILGCSDSRVPAELVFDQGLGDLFVIRVAGNIVAPSQIGSVEFAAGQFHTRLVVVLGHSNCGAISATVDELQQPGNEQSANIRSIVERISPSVEVFRHTEIWNDKDNLVEQSMRANIRASVNQLRHGSQILEDLVRNDGLMIVGAEYSLETGEVEFFSESAPA